MYHRLVNQIRLQLNSLVDQYDARLRLIPGYASLPETTRRDLAQRVLNLVAHCLEINDDQGLVDYIHERAEQVLKQGFEPEWFQQAVSISESLIMPLVATVEEGTFVWRAMSHAQTTAWRIVAEERQRIEKSLRDSEARYQTIFDSTPVMFWLKDTQNNTLRINRAAAAFEGVNAADVEGKSAYDLYPREQAEAFYQDDLQVIRSGVPKLGIVEQHTSVGGGELMWVETGKVPVRSDRGEVTGVLAFAVDITERIRLQEQERHGLEQARSTSERLRTVITAADELIRIADFDQLTRRAVELAREKLGIERCGLFLLDEAGEQLIGTYGTDDQRRTTDERSAREPVDRHLPVLSAPPDRLWVQRETPLSYWEGGAQRAIGTGWVVGTRIHSANRTLGILYNDAALTGASLDESQQEILAVYCSLLGNILERRRAEIALLSSQQRLSLLIEQSPLAVVEWNTAFEVVSWNPAAERIFGYTRDEALGRRAAGLIVPAEAHSSSESVWQSLLQQTGSTRTTNDNLTKDRRTITCEWFNAPLVDASGQTIGVASLVEDITERRSQERTIQESLERRSRQVQTSTEISQEIAASFDLNEIFRRVVTLIKERFGYYHAQIFRYDPARDAVVLVSGYGDAGQRMLAAGHQLVMGRGVVGTAAATGRTILATDVALDKDWQANPNLPKTKGELAIPIRLGKGDAETQVNAVKYFVDSDFDGLAVTAIDPTATAVVTHEALQRGKPVITITSDLGQENQTTLIFAVEHELGYLLGAQAGAWAKERLPNGQTLKLCVLNYRILPQVIQRENGIIDGIKAVFGENIEIMGNEPVVAPGVASLLTEAWLRAWPDLHMIVAINDASALEAYQVVSATGRNDPDQFFIGGIDAVPEALAAIKEGGAFQATVNQSPEVMGIMAVRTLVAAIKGLSVEPIQTLLCTPVNRANVDEFSEPNRDASVLADQNIIAAEILAGLEIRGLRLGLSVLSLANPFFATLAESAQREAQRLGVQLTINDPRQILGILDVQSDQAGILTTEDQLVLEGLCGQIATAMESTRLLQETQHTQQFLNSLIENLPIMIFAKEAKELRFVRWNKAGEELAGFKQEEMLGKNDYDFFPKEEADFFTTKDREVLAGTVQVDIPEEPIQTRHRGPRLLHTRKIPVLDEQGQPQYLLGISEDITERKRSEQQMELTLREMERLYATVSREGWQTYRRTTELPEGFLYDRFDLQPLAQPPLRAIEQAVEQHRMVTTETDNQIVTAAPLAVRGEIIGALGLYDDPDRPLLPEDLALVTAVSEQVALALESARLFDQTQSALAETRALFHFSELVSRETEVKPIYDGVARLLVNEIGFNSAWVAEVDAEARLLRGIAGAGAGMTTEAITVSVPYLSTQMPATIAAREKEMVVVNDPFHDERLGDLPDHLKAVIGKAIVVPVIIGGEIVSVIAAARPADGQDINERDQRLLQAAATQVAIAIQRARLFERTQHDAERERTINRIASQIRNAQSVDQVLEIAAQELSLLTRASRSVVEIRPSSPAANQTGNGNGVKE